MTPEKWREIERLYHLAHERGHDVLADADPEIRKQVEKLLAQDSGGKILDGHLAGLAGDLLEDSRITIGTQLGSYQIIELLGAGGMGEVYRARDAKLGRDVALKVLPIEVVAEPERRSRLLSEARAAASLNHPNICTIHEIGEAEGHAYIAMEVIEGQTLSRRLADGAMAPDAVVRYGFQLAEALSHAHDRGVIHRDVKSGNVIVTPEGRIKLLDFGLAKRFSQDDLTEAVTKSNTPLTSPGTLLGTVAYMAPEQLRGQQADARSDIWAVGVVLYEMSTGRRPFDGRTTYELSSAILQSTPPSLPPAISPQLQAVITRCLEKEPGRRYQRAGELRAALETVSSAGHKSVMTQSRRPAVVGALVFAVLLAGAAWFTRIPIRQWLFGNAARQIQSIAVLPLENLSGDSQQDYFADGIHEALITDLARIGLKKVIAKPSADMFKGTKKPLHDVGLELGVDGLVTGSVMRANDRIRITAQLVRAASGEVLWANRYERNAGDVLALQNEIVAAIAGEVKAQIAPEQSAHLAAAHPVNPAAHDAYLKGRSLWGSFVTVVDRKALDAVIAQLEEAIKLDPSYAPPYAAISNAYITATQTSFLPPKETFPKAKSAALRAVELDDRLAEGHAVLSQVYLWHDWDWAAAEREIHRAMQLNPDSIDALTASESYSLLVKGKVDEAVATSQRIVDVDPLNPFVRVQTIWTSFLSRQHDDSIRHSKTLIELAPNSFFPHFFLAMNYAVKHMRAEVNTECDKVRELLSGRYDMQTLATCVWALGSVGEIEKARRLLQVVEHPPSGLWLDPVMMAAAYTGLGDTDRAIGWYQKGLEERSPNMVYIKVSPGAWDALRGDVRFQSIQRQMNFPQ